MAQWLTVTPQPEAPELNTSVPLCGLCMLPDDGICMFGALDQGTAFKTHTQNFAETSCLSQK